MSTFIKPRCNVPLNLCKLKGGKFAVSTPCRAPHRHEGSHIWDLYVGDGSKFIRVYSDQIEKL